MHWESGLWPLLYLQTVILHLFDWFLCFAIWQSSVFAWKEIHFYIAFVATNCGNWKFEAKGGISIQMYKLYLNLCIALKTSFSSVHSNVRYIQLIKSLCEMHTSFPSVNKLCLPRQCSQIVSESKKSAINLFFQAIQELSNRTHTNIHFFLGSCISLEIL